MTAVASCLAWHQAASGAWQLLSGDADGQVCVWQLSAGEVEEAPRAPRELWRADASVLQVEAGRGALVVSTYTRSTLLRLGEGGELGGVLPIGRKLREGHYGACFLGGAIAAAPAAAVVAARPGRRLWLVDGAGTVLSTLRLPAPADGPHMIPSSAAARFACSTASAPAKYAHAESE